MRDPFLESLWHKDDKKDDSDWVDETAGDLENPDKIWATNAYLDMIQGVDFDNNTKELTEDIRQGVLKYIQSIDSLSASRIKNQEPKTVEEKDAGRKHSHDALIASLNALSRYHRQIGLDNEWRRVIGLDRKSVTKWAKNVVDFVIKEAESKT